jgi:hypothetical protein
MTLLCLTPEFPDIAESGSRVSMTPRILRRICPQLPKELRVAIRKCANTPCFQPINVIHSFLSALFSPICVFNVSGWVGQCPSYLEDWNKLSVTTRDSSFREKLLALKSKLVPRRSLTLFPPQGRERKRLFIFPSCLSVSFRTATIPDSLIFLYFEKSEMLVNPISFVLYC